MMRWNAQVLLHEHNALGEGPCWDPRNQRLYWLDIFGKVLFIREHEALRRLTLPKLMGTLALTEDPEKLILAGEGGIYYIHLPGGTITPVADPEPDLPEHRFNDGKCGPDGRFWAGGVRLQGCEQSPDCKFYRMDPDESVTEILPSVQISNGLAWSPDHKTFYYIDSAIHKIWAYDFDAQTGEIRNRRCAVVFPDDAVYEPDGMTIDDEGMLWVAMWEDWCVLRCDPSSGEIIGRVEVDAPLASCPIFGGPDLSTLYITSASSCAFGKPVRSENEGALFAVETGCRGLPPYVFGRKCQ